MNRAYKRLTFKYNDDYSELDEWSDDYIDYEVLDESIIEDDDIDDGYSKVITVKTKESGLSKEKVYNYLRGDFKKSCSCEHDCCGHYFGGLRKTEKINDSEFLIVAHYALNY